MLEPASRQVESIYMEKRVFKPSKDFVEKARLKQLEDYEHLYKRSIENPQKFWADMAEEHLDWFKKWDGAVEDYDFKDDTTSAISQVAS